MVKKKKINPDAFEMLLNLEGEDLDKLASIKVKCGEKVRIFLPVIKGGEDEKNN